ncbi:MAG: LysM peptidoglycan-binding domain-containing protein [Thiotrichales bacterium]
MSNKLVILLIALNALILLAFVWLIGALTGMNIKESAVAAAEKVVRERLDAATLTAEPTLAAPVTLAQPVAQTTPRPLGTEAVAQPAEAPLAAPVAPATDTATEIEPPQRGYVAREEVLHRDDQIAAYIESAFAQPAAASATDADYAAAVVTLKRASEQPRRTPEVPRDAAVAQPVRIANEKKTDHYNKIDVSQRAAPDAGTAPSIEQRLEQAAALAVDDAVLAPATTAPEEPGRLYLYALDEEVRERVNEARTVIVERGDTLWKIAARAYGDGNLYPKIFAANPQLRSPNQIEVGDVLRVPL